MATLPSQLPVASTSTLPPLPTIQQTVLPPLPATSTPPSPSFYKRPLPPQCIPFASTRGKSLFAKALAEGGMESYFPLASHFLTQSEPAFCGLGTLCMILNALEVDPQRKWKGPWRWYEQEMLDCCRPLTAVAKVGITLSEFACLARCNGLSASTVSPSPSASPEAKQAGLTKFRRDLKAACGGGKEGEEGMMAFSYSRKSLGQTGDGHFSPVGGYCEEEDMILILDVARFKYPSYWISVEQAWEAMLPLDKATGQPRGYSLLRLLPGSTASDLGTPQSLTTLTLNKSTWANLFPTLSRLALSPSTSSSAYALLKALSSHIARLPTSVLGPRSAFQPGSNGQHDYEHSLRELYRLLEGSSIARIIQTESDGRTGLAQTSLFLLSLLSGSRSPILSLLPEKTRSELADLTRETLGIEGEVGETLRKEVQALNTQVEALGECCKAEQGGGTCGCGNVAT